MEISLPYSVKLGDALKLCKRPEDQRALQESYDPPATPSDLLAFYTIGAQRSQCTTVSSGLRAAGLNVVPRV